MDGPMKITTAEMECTIASWFNYRANLVVPNVHWGMNMHECDLLVLSKAGYVTEVEIKISRADLRADAKKLHGHRSNKIKYLYFAVPDNLEAAALELAPERAGIITVARCDRPSSRRRGELRCNRIRNPICTKHSLPMSDRDRYKVARLGALRIWNLKRKIING